MLYFYHTHTHTIRKSIFRKFFEKRLFVVFVLLQLVWLKLQTSNGNKKKKSKTPNPKIKGKMKSINLCIDIDNRCTVHTQVPLTNQHMPTHCFAWAIGKCERKNHKNGLCMKTIFNCKRKNNENIKKKNWLP